MCGRTCLTLNKDQMRCACSYKQKHQDKYTKPEWLDEHNAGKPYTPSYNIAPTDITPVLVSGSKFNNCSSLVALKPMMWGIIPPWHKGDYKSHNLSTNNCRLENIKQSKLYGPILRSGGRCVIAVEGFYEWETTKKSPKPKPYYIYTTQDNEVKMDEPETWNNNFSEDKGWSGVRLLYMAGLYSVWQNENNIIYSYSVITMESNATLNWLHHRMPAILGNVEQLHAWLDTEEVNHDMALAYLTRAKVLSWHLVSTTVNNSKNKSSDCNKTVIESKTSQKTLKDWFQPEAKRRKQ